MNDLIRTENNLSTIFCSKKLSDLLGLKIKKIELYDSKEKWNGHLFYIDKKKCLIFIHKDTLYSFVLFDILKKDLTNFNKVFIDSFVKQLYSDNILPQDNEEKIRNDYKQIKLQSSDNDKKTIGSLNDCVLRIKWSESFHGAIEYVEQNINSTPMGSKIFGSRKYIFPKDEMREKIKNNT